MSYQRVCSLSEVADGEALPVSVGDLELVVARHGDDVFALTDLCSHQDYPLSDGDVEIVDGVPTIECTWHGSCFDLRTGAPTNLPANQPVTSGRQVCPAVARGKRRKAAPSPSWQYL